MARWPFRSNRGKFHLTIVSSTDEKELIPAYEESNCDIYGLIIANTSGNSCNVTIKDDVEVDNVFAVPAGETRGFMVPKESAEQQAVGNKRWTVQCSAAVANIEITAFVNRNS